MTCPFINDACYATCPLRNNNGCVLSELRKLESVSITLETIQHRLENIESLLDSN